ncbi:hypothetical protein JOF41_005931 [Saccharothrix coeruleofusca]|uniref:hypothetical protein n=1 Tax=Saccharothrix coeruleofusca TaxID=33919 RepID=UPI0027DBB6EF|nr:hypothetical protein [Saccharothrix coeruleofusca]MBP2339753.1 hypothetical protein [Saccharothrix coeruleofusca]
MSTDRLPDEQERLVADALRAQATSTSVPRPDPVPGSASDSAPDLAPDLGADAPAAPGDHAPKPDEPRIGAVWVLLLALLLGLASGTVVAVITLR